MRLLSIACGLLLLTSCHNIYQLRRAAVKGDAAAQYEYGRRLLTGQKGAIRSYKNAFRWFARAAEQKDSRAMAAMGLCYERGLGVQRSLRKARLWYAAAVDEGNDNACQTLVQMEARAGNLGGALQWLERMADDDSIPAQLMLAHMHLNGTARNASAAEGIRYLRYAAMQGNGEACLMLSTCYATGKGVPKNDELMMGWLVNAAEAGNQTAVDLLNQSRLRKK
ncbi:MAG: sel1 repeat family protein [Akkermansia sp.]|nr:sel1 repeat family protein [Akkermansia sp.]MBR2313994.1 sel1 repeat family protein [Akkermansia sp.]